MVRKIPTLSATGSRLISEILPIKSAFFWRLEYIAQLSDYRNKRILDVGCGFGWQAFTISLLDSENRIVAIDILPSMFEGMGA